MISLNITFTESIVEPQDGILLSIDASSIPLTESQCG
jgi:hypothetical protein